ncbi:MAG: DUF4377 domain-containing protein [Cyclobacteriaceae bacterium]
MNRKINILITKQYPKLLILVWLVWGCTSQPVANENQPPDAAMNQEIELNEGESVLWVNSLRVPCTGVAPQRCLQVQKRDSLDDTAWEYFYDTIEGFDFQGGYVYQLVVKEEQLPSEEVPADDPSIRYTLVKVLDKQNDPRLVLNDIWMLESLEGQPIDTTQLIKHPYLEIHLADQRVMGHDGCNQFNGGIELANDQKLVFGVLASTRKMCQQMEVPDKFSRLIGATSTYSLEDNVLRLYDEQQNELMTLGKTD